MPELPEVERAVRLLQQVAKGKRISSIQSFPDSIVFSGVTHQEFVKELEGRVVLDAKRYGKVFYLTLDGKGKSPVLHFGMTGMLQVKGAVPLHYKEAPRKPKDPNEWPPRFSKFILHLHSPSESPTEDPGVEIAFLDARRLGRIRLCSSPAEEPPISELGFDPILSMPLIDTFSTSVIKRSCPIKALLLDQSFSAGVGNWVADEVLYHARIHPEQRCNTLSSDQIKQLHKNLVYVCQTAVDLNADDKRFPENWLFRHRWGKGKKKSGHPLLLPSGKPATIKWLKVGGRTSAFVTELQHLGKAQNPGPVADETEESDLTLLSDSESLGLLPATTKRKRTKKKSEQMVTNDDARLSTRSSKRLKTQAK
ncbi:AtMMH-1 [Coprinopsis marcescibilis]|uniref:AtMMH-1 n=1 Tax=Coprinopsis marcescibilis TaxID=230819 RepID=A0A5C3LPQ0_COPMA|nr:AtMMH-1 [Coprinopsis marcescibilis]